MVANSAPNMVLLDIPQSDLKWSSIDLSEILNKNRLEASFFNIEGKNAREVVNSSKWSKVTLSENKGLIKSAFYPI